jgi:hypothetical protein
MLGCSGGYQKYLEDEMKNKSCHFRSASLIVALHLASIATLQLASQPTHASVGVKGETGNSMSHAVDKISMPVAPNVCAELGFTPRTSQLTGRGIKAIRSIATQWQRSANNTGLAVKLVVAIPAPAGPTADKPAHARELAALRKQSLATALLSAGIPESNFVVWVAAAPQNQKLSCNAAIQ